MPLETNEYGSAGLQSWRRSVDKNYSTLRWTALLIGFVFCCALTLVLLIQPYRVPKLYAVLIGPDIHTSQKTDLQSLLARTEQKLLVGEWSKLAQEKSWWINGTFGKRKLDPVREFCNNVSSDSVILFYVTGFLVEQNGAVELAARSSNLGSTIGFRADELMHFVTHSAAAQAVLVVDVKNRPGLLLDSERQQAKLFAYEQLLRDELCGLDKAAACLVLDSEFECGHAKNNSNVGMRIVEWLEQCISDGNRLSLHDLMGSVSMSQLAEGHWLTSGAFDDSQQICLHREVKELDTTTAEQPGELDGAGRNDDEIQLLSDVVENSWASVHGDTQSAGSSVTPNWDSYTRQKLATLEKLSEEQDSIDLLRTIAEPIELNRTAKSVGDILGDRIAATRISLSLPAVRQIAADLNAEMAEVSAVFGSQELEKQVEFEGMISAEASEEEFLAWIKANEGDTAVSGQTKYRTILLAELNWANRARWLRAVWQQERLSSSTRLQTAIPNELLGLDKSLQQIMILCEHHREGFDLLVDAKLQQIEDSQRQLLAFLQASENADWLALRVIRELPKWMELIPVVQDQALERDPVCVLLNRLTHLEEHFGFGAYQEYAMLEEEVELAEKQYQGWHSKFANECEHSTNSGAALLDKEWSCVCSTLNARPVDRLTFRRRLESTLDRYTALLMYFGSVRPNEKIETTFDLVMQCHAIVSDESTTELKVEQSLKQVQEAVFALLSTSDESCPLRWQKLRASWLGCFGVRNQMLDDFVVESVIAQVQKVGQFRLAALVDSLSESSAQMEADVLREVGEWRRLCRRMVSNANRLVSSRVDSDWNGGFPVGIRLPADIDLKGSPNGIITVEMENLTGSEVLVQVSSVNNVQGLLVEFAEGESKSDARVIDPQRSSFETFAIPARRMLLVPIRVRCAEDAWTGMIPPLVLRFEVAGDSRRRLIEIRKPNAPFIEAFFASKSLGWDNGIGHGLLANQDNLVEVQIQNVATAGGFTFELFATEELNEPPVGSIKDSDSLDWLDRNNCVQVSSIPKPVALASHNSMRMKWPASKVAVDAKFGQLILKATRVEDHAVQLVSWIPQVHRPSGLVKPKLIFDEGNGILRFSASLASEVNALAGNVACEFTLIREEDHAEIATVNLQLNDEIDSAEGVFTNLGSDRSARLVRVNIDDWPSAFLFRVEFGMQGTAVAGAFREIAPERVRCYPMSRVQGSKIVPTDAKQISAVVETWATEDSFAKNWDSISVGLDLNGDRYLNDNWNATFESPTRLVTRYVGVTKQGYLQIRPAVSSQVAELDVLQDWNGKVNLICSANNTTGQVWSSIQELIVDHTEPSIKSIGSVTGDPAPIGVPLELQIEVDDGELSGVSFAEVAWSLDGTPVFNDANKPVRGQQGVDGIWRALLPTKNMLPGRKMLLAKATDRAGNQSPIIEKFVELIPAEIYEQLSRPKGWVNGKAMYGRNALKDLVVKLTPQDDPEAEQVSLEKNDEREWTTVTNANGEFQFSSVPEGAYLMELKGLVKGMRVVRQREIEVIAPGNPNPELFRFDWPEKKVPPENE